MFVSAAAAQAALRKVGAKIGVDGRFGPATKRAWASFASGNHLNPRTNIGVNQR